MKEEKNTIMIVQISFWLNGKLQGLCVPPGMTTLEMLNERLQLTGTKSSCNEGDCGACTVVIGQKKDNQVVYQAVNSCIYPAYRLNGKHLITIEGISSKTTLNPIQLALLDEHGTQCGFCTPGIVMSILGLFLNSPNPDNEAIKAALEGNLCRCTGYDSILKAAKLAKDKIKKTGELLPARLRKIEKDMTDRFTPLCFDETDNAEGWDTRNCYLPKSLSELWDNLGNCKHHGQSKYIAGGTDLMVLANIQHIRYPNLIDLTNIKELNGVKSENGRVIIGANTTMSELIGNELFKAHFPVLSTALKQMASTQIRNSATLAGNIANASPVADGATTLLALEAKLVLVSKNAEREIKLDSFYQGYKKTVLKQDEIIRAIIIPIPDTNERYTNFIKSAKRKAVDISSVVSVISVEYKKDRISRVILSFGGVAAYPALATKTMAFMQRKKLEESWILNAAEEAMGEFKPITDIRGHEEYRSLLIKNHVIKHLRLFLREVNQ